MAELKPPAAMEPVEIELGDGKKRELAYPIGTLQRIKKALGASIFSGKGFSIDEDTVPSLIWHGLHDAEGNPPDVPLEKIQSLQPAAPWMNYLSQRFILAYTGSLPPEKKEPETTADAKLPLN
jgi:hypothetical protein